MKLSFLFLTLFLYTRASFAQDSTYGKALRNWKIQSTDILVGVNWQGSTRDEKTRRYFEIGVARGKYISHRHGINGGAIYVSEEMHFGRDKNIFGTKVGAWIHWMLDFGMAAIYYTDFDKGNFKIRPEIGIGVGRVRAVVGYNIPTIHNRAFKELEKNSMQISIQLTAGIRKKKINQ